MNNHQESYSKVGQVVELFSKIYNEGIKKTGQGGGDGKGKEWERGCKWGTVPWENNNEIKAA